ncbi:MAG: transposase [Clostridia bacterium]|nr:transposase [Clostridia bacterium]
MDNELPKRKPTRLKNFDYNSSGAYFLTICTENRRRILSRIVGGDVPDAPKDTELLPYGKIADKYINQLNNFYNNISVDRYVIMPNHIHIMLLVHNDGASRTSPPTVKQHSYVSRFVSTFKRFCNKEYGENIWQRHFNDHIIRNREDYEEHIKYIYENPMRWYYDELYTEE